MNTTIMAWLLDLGLDEQRSKIYLAALSQGECRASDLAKTLGKSRTAIYDNLQFLERRGFLRRIQEGKRQLFVPLHPKELLKKVQSQQQQLEELLPDFLAVYAAKTKQPFVQLFRGNQASREVYEDILQVKPKSYIYLSSPRQTYKSIDKRYIREWVKRRVKLGIRSRGLRTEKLAHPDDQIFSGQENYLRELRYLPANLDLRSTIYVYLNNIGVISGDEEQTAVIIYSPDLAATLQQIFDFLWVIGRKT